ncbi:hypothetical protein ACOZFM_34815 [Streptomyces arboris]|uniref:hypothetical protein n=1 Tax=Streptomyces arboris TaxID=2600619 RepID=UPI003BF49D46
MRADEISGPDGLFNVKKRSILKIGNQGAHLGGRAELGLGVRVEESVPPLLHVGFKSRSVHSDQTSSHTDVRAQRVEPIRALVEGGGCAEVSGEGRPTALNHCLTRRGAGDGGSSVTCGLGLVVPAAGLDAGTKDRADEGSDDGAAHTDHTDQCDGHVVIHMLNLSRARQG